MPKISSPHLIVSPQVGRAWSKHVDRWGECQRCPLGSTANEHVLARGQLSCDVLFLGEAPGSSEDLLGFPFIGPAGKLLDKIIAACNPVTTFKNPKRADTANVVRFWTYCISNILACVPWLGDPADRKLRPPESSEAAACSPRLTELVMLANPKGFVYLGKVAQKYAGMVDSKKVLYLPHPAYLLRKGGASPKNVEYKRTVLQLREFLKQVL